MGKDSFVKLGFFAILGILVLAVIYIFGIGYLSDRQDTVESELAALQTRQQEAVLELDAITNEDVTASDRLAAMRRVEAVSRALPGTSVVPSNFDRALSLPKSRQMSMRLSGTNDLIEKGPLLFSSRTFVASGNFNDWGILFDVLLADSKSATTIENVSLVLEEGVYTGSFDLVVWFSDVSPCDTPGLACR